MRKLDYSAQFRRDYKLCKKQGKDMNKLNAVLQILATGEPIPPRYKDHPLKNNWTGFRDLHIEPDWILIYKIVGDTVVFLAATRTHARTLYS